MGAILFSVKKPTAPPPDTTSTITYYFDGYLVDGNEWNLNPGQMVDGVLGNVAISQAFADPHAQTLNSNTAPGTDLGTIETVELRLDGSKASGTIEYFDIRPVFTGGNGDLHDLVSSLTTSVDWSDYLDITNDTNAPGTWSWTDVQNLDCIVRSSITTSGPGDLSRASKVEIKVTYTS